MSRTQAELEILKARQRELGIRVTKATNAIRHIAKVDKWGRVKVRVPMEVAALAVGRDAWMADVIARCKCGRMATVRDLYRSELPGHCDECAEKFFRCEKCGGTHHPDDECTGKPNADEITMPPAYVMLDLLKQALPIVDQHRLLALGEGDVLAMNIREILRRNGEG